MLLINMTKTQGSENNIKVQKGKCDPAATHGLQWNEEVYLKHETKKNMIKKLTRLQKWCFVVTPVNIFQTT